MDEDGETYTGVPHFGQKVAPGGSSDPQLWQYLVEVDTKIISRGFDLKHIIDLQTWELYLWLIGRY